MRALVLADTHTGVRTDAIPAEVWDAARAADVVLHAGDVVHPALLDELRRLAPVHAVLGNNDAALRGCLPVTLQVDLGGVRVAMIHDSGPTTGRANRMTRRFPDAQVVVFGHSHLPVDEPGVDGQRLFNPGSCTQRRRAPGHTYGWLELDGGAVVDHRIVDVAGAAVAAGSRGPR